MLTVRSKALGPPCWRMTQFVAGKAHLAKKKNESYLINPSLSPSLSLSDPESQPGQLVGILISLQNLSAVCAARFCLHISLLFFFFFCE